MPENARISYNLAIAFQTLSKPIQAEEAYNKAIELAPENSDYRYGICTLYLQEQQYAKAEKHAKKLAELQPNNPQVQSLLKMMENNMRSGK